MHPQLTKFLSPTFKLETPTSFIPGEGRDVNRRTSGPQKFTPLEVGDWPETSHKLSAQLRNSTMVGEGRSLPSGFPCAAAPSSPGSVPRCPCLERHFGNHQMLQLGREALSLFPGFWARMRGGMGVRYPGNCGPEEGFSRKQGRSPSRVPLALRVSRLKGALLREGLVFSRRDPST